MGWYIGKDEGNYICHHGIPGQRWGKRNGPPYPLDYETASKVRMNKNNGPQSHYFREENSDLRKSLDKHPVEKLSELKRLDDVSSGALLDRFTKINEKEDNETWDDRTYNCPNCALAFEMTNRGYDVKSRPAKVGSNVGYIEKFFKDAKLKNSDYNPGEDGETDIGMMGLNAGKKLRDEILNEGGRGIIVIGWASDSLMYEGDFSKTGRTTKYHAINYKVENGDVKIFDTQSTHDFKNKGIPFMETSSWYYSDPRELYYMRTDNASINDNIGEAVYSS